MSDEPSADSAGSGSDPAPQPEDRGDVTAAWRAGVERIRSTLRWVLGGLAGALTLAIGAGPFLNVDQIDSRLRLGWVLWGLAAAIGGYILILRASTPVFLPESGGIAELVDPTLSSGNAVVAASAEHFQRELTALGDLDYDVKELCGDDASHQSGVARYWAQYIKLDSFLLKAEKEAAMAPQDESLKLRVGLLKSRTMERQRNLRQFVSRSIYREVRERLLRSLPWIFIGAVLVAAGIFVYLIAAQPSPASSVEDDSDANTSSVADAASQGDCNVGSAVLAICIANLGGTWNAPSSEAVDPDDEESSGEDLFLGLPGGDTAIQSVLVWTVTGVFIVAAHVTMGSRLETDARPRTKPEVASWLLMLVIFGLLIFQVLVVAQEGFGAVGLSGWASITVVIVAVLLISLWLIHWGRLGRLVGRGASVTDDLERIRASIVELQDRLAPVSADIESAEARMETIREELTEVDERTQEL